MYDVDVDETEMSQQKTIPDVLKFCLKKTYKFTLLLTKENITEGSNVYNASNISETVEMSATHSPNQKHEALVGKTQQTVVSFPEFFIIKCFYLC